MEIQHCNLYFQEGIGHFEYRSRDALLRCSWNYCKAPCLLATIQSDSTLFDSIWKNKPSSVSPYLNLVYGHICCVDRVEVYSEPAQMAGL